MLLTKVCVGGGLVILIVGLCVYAGDVNGMVTVVKKNITPLVEDLLTLPVRVMTRIMMINVNVSCVASQDSLIVEA